MDCPNDRYVNDEAICQAVAAMLARIGIKVNSERPDPRALFRQDPRARLQHQLLHAGLDAGRHLRRAQRLRADHADARPQRRKGVFNVGGYSNARFDELADKIEQETDKEKRDAMIDEAHKIHQRRRRPHPAASAGDRVGGPSNNIELVPAGGQLSSRCAT